ncbi:GGDEF domain-containing protein, partial [Pseudomonas faucium]|uniref:GGDEF domain-containing protein n=1 Tax=Pseudomonas faucium TaxID=2740518 RepID=UPI001596DDC2
VRGALAQLAGMLLASALLGTGLQLTTSPLQVYACLPMLTLYPLALGWVCYRLAIKLADHVAEGVVDGLEVVGDCVLRQLSDELKRNLRESDLAGRYGGDEFCVILPGASEAQACQAMERLRQQVASYRNPQLPHLKISLSIGLSAFQAGLPCPERWLELADQALYSA